jgi:hypothetical protein
MTEPNPPAASELRTRMIGYLETSLDLADITVDHVWLPDGEYTCPGCGSGRDPGMVGLLITDSDDDTVRVLLTDREALWLADRLTRGAHLVMESGEEPPDVEREAARFTEAREPAGELRTPPARPEDPVRAAVWQAFRQLDEDEPSPVKAIARSLDMTATDVAAIVFPADKFGAWEDSLEPDLPES